MKKAISKRKELIMVAVVSTLSIGLFSASSLGINQLTFAAATDRAEPLLPVVEYDYTTLDIQSELDAEETEKVAGTDLDVYEKESDLFYEDTSDLDIYREESNFFYEDTSDNTVHQPIMELDTGSFQSPRLTLGTPRGAICASAMPHEEAAQIGARYISDVFGTSIDIMHITMHYNCNLMWDGMVSTSEFEYFFTIHSITGQWINLTRWPLPHPERDARWQEEQFENSMNALIATGWRDMPIDAQIEFADVSSKVREYEQAALELATRHFNQSVVIDIQLSFLVDAYANEAGGVNVQGFEFAAIDDTGREALVTVYRSDSRSSGFVSINTWHNDISW